MAWFKDAEHFKSVCGYEINGGWYPRVTQILSIKAKPALEFFFKEVGSYAAADDIKTKSAEEGTLVHETIQKLAVGEAIAVPKEIEPAASAFKEFQEKNQIFFHPEYVESRVWSNLHRYSGTVDALATIGGKFGVLDIKTSTGFYPEYNLQTAAYVLALQENDLKRALALPRDIETRWILRVDQQKKCLRCGASLREKGGRNKVRTARVNGSNGNGNGHCGASHEDHYWGPMEGIVELREFPYYFKDIKAFLAAKTLWEWENDYWLKQVGYLNK